MRRINLSAAAIVLVCFFLPWVQVSCAGAIATSSGLNLARHDDVLLWMIPLLMGAVLIFGLLRFRRASPQLLGVLSAASGIIVFFLMNRERSQVRTDAGLLATQLTGWFWLAFFAAIVMVVTAVGLILRKPRAPAN